MRSRCRSHGSKPGTSNIAAPRTPLPAGVWALGLVSLFMDVSSEMIHALMPVFVVGTLGASTIWLGVIEGVAEATANIVKVFSGALSDRWGKRKSLALLGYGLAALTKPLFPLAGSAMMVFAARCIDRVGKGIRGAPRDALVADFTTPDQRGAAYGLRQSLDTVGAFMGPLIAIGLLMLLANDVRAVFWIAIIPALISVAILWFAVKEPAHLKPMQKRVVDLRARDLPKPFWVIATIATFFTLARYSEAFLILRGTDIGLSITWAPLVLVVMNVAYMLSAYPVGVLADRMPRHHILLLGAAVLVLANLVLAGAHDPTTVLLGVALWGLHMGLTEGVFTAMIADAAPADLRGTAFGVFNLMRGLLLLMASVIAGVMWDASGPVATFITAAVLAAFSMLLLMASRSMLRS